MMQEDDNNVEKGLFGWNNRSALQSLYFHSLFSLCGAVLQLHADVWTLLWLRHPQCVTGSVPGGEEQQVVATLITVYWPACYLSSEPDLSQCNRSQWDSGLCPGHGDGPPAVQSPICCPFMGVSSHTDSSCLISLFFECFTHLLSLLARGVVATLLAGFLIDKLGIICKSMCSLVTNPWCWAANLCRLKFLCLQLESICSPLCVYSAQRCLRWAPTTAGRPICFRWCSRADCYSEQALGLW